MRPLMSTLAWQDLVVLICVMASVAYLVRRVYRALISPHASACNQCAHSPITGIRQKPLVPVELLTPSSVETTDSAPNTDELHGRASRSP